MNAPFSIPIASEKIATGVIFGYEVPEFFYSLIDLFNREKRPANDHLQSS